MSNQAQRWQGQGDSPLSVLGRSQARALAQRIGHRHYHRVIASDLSRASDTAQATGFAFERDKTFREFDVGCWEGLTRDEVAERYPEEIARLKQGEDLPLGGGESFAVFAKRIDDALARVRASLTEGDHVLIVCHGGVIGTALSGMLGLRGGRRFPLASVSNTSISEVDVDLETGAAVRLRVFNDGRHVSDVSRWPSFDYRAGCMALISGGPPAAGYGAFEAHYEAPEHLLELTAPAGLGASELDREQQLREVLRAIGTKHPERRVSVSATAERIRQWAASALWGTGRPAAELELPRVGSLCHLGTFGENLVLQDYGVSLED